MTNRKMTVKEKTQTRAHMRSAGLDPKDFTPAEFVRYSKEHGLMKGEDYTRDDDTSGKGSRTEEFDGGRNDTSDGGTDGGEGGTDGGDDMSMADDDDGEGESGGAGAGDGESESEGGEGGEGEGETGDGEGGKQGESESESEGETETEQEPKPEPETMMEKPVYDIVWQCIDWHHANHEHGGGGLDAAAVQAIVERAVTAAGGEQSKKEATFKRKGFKKSSFDHKHPKLDLVLKFLACGQNVYMKGEAGSGKTTIASQCATTIDVPFYMTGKVDDVFTITGYTDANGKYVETEFYKCFSGGGVFLADEMDRYSAGAFVIVNAAADQRYMSFPGIGLVHAHKDFYFIGAGNTDASGADRKYTAAQNLDKSTMNRFSKITIEQDLGLERAVALGINPKCGKWVDMCQQLRSEISKLGLDAMVTPRNTKNGAILLAGGLSLKEVISAQILEGNSLDTQKQLSKMIKAAA